MKVALVHDWLVTYRGGEKVLEAIAELFPDAELFTLFHEPGAVSSLDDRRVHTSFLNRWPFARARYRHFLPLFPKAIEALDLSGVDLVISSSHCVAKGVRKPVGAKHLSYVHAPMRYMWDRYEDYFGPGRASRAVRTAAWVVRPYLQRWDRRSSAGVDRFVANSHYIAQRIAATYGREAAVVHPPVELGRFASQPLEGTGKGGYYLWLGALAPYKRVDVAIEAFRRLRSPLWIGGTGQDEALVRHGLPSNVKWLGQVADVDLPALYRDARALVFAGEEDFGITPLEAQACGRPVIALGRGGVLETVTAKTGRFFSEQTPEALAAAVTSFEAWEEQFHPADARAHASRFTKNEFQRRFLEELSRL
ncbi:MAG: glycosyltransferase [Myxococcota bacterium]